MITEYGEVLHQQAIHMQKTAGFECTSSICRKYETYMARNQTVRLLAALSVLERNPLQQRYGSRRSYSHNGQSVRLTIHLKISLSKPPLPQTLLWHAWEPPVRERISLHTKCNLSLIFYFPCPNQNLTKTIRIIRKFDNMCAYNGDAHIL